MPPKRRDGTVPTRCSVAGCLNPLNMNERFCTCITHRLRRRISHHERNPGSRVPDNYEEIKLQVDAALKLSRKPKPWIFVPSEMSPSQDRAARSIDSISAQPAPDTTRDESSHHQIPGDRHPSIAGRWQLGRRVHKALYNPYEHQ